MEELLNSVRKLREGQDRLKKIRQESGVCYEYYALLKDIVESHHILFTRLQLIDDEVTRDVIADMELRFATHLGKSPSTPMDVFLRNLKQKCSDMMNALSPDKQG